MTEYSTTLILLLNDYNLPLRCHLIISFCRMTEYFTNLMYYLFRLRNMTELVHTKFDESSARMDKLVHANALLCRQNEALFELTARLEERVKATEGKKLS